MKKYSKFIRRQKMPQLQLQDKKMPMTQILKPTNSLKFIHPGQGNQVSAARTSEPLPSSSAVVYFEAYVRTLNARYEAGVGIIQKDCALKRHPGQSNMSIGYLSNGDIYVNGKKSKRVPGYKAKSTIGVGIVYSKQQVFFTADGTLLETLSFQHNPATWPKFFPCISLRNQGDHIELRFKNFAYNFEQLRTKIQLQCLQQIDKQTVSSESIYSLVGDYLKFHGYRQTYTKLKQNQKFPQLTSFVEHPFWQSKLSFPSAEEMDIENTANNEQSKKNQQDEYQEQLIMNRKCSTRQRIMSDYWGDILPNELPRKRIYEQERLLLESRRKSSVISNMENEGVKEVEEQDHDHDGIGGNSQREVFLAEKRILALKCIREEKIEEALEILQQGLPQLFEVLAYLQAYFYMHIYLRILKNDGPTKAMLYMRTHTQKFKKFKQQLYPIFCLTGNRLKFVSFSQMMGLVSLKPGNNHEALTDQQFYAFSNYVNELILKNLGLYPESRLDTLVNHLKCIGVKGEQYQINGLSVGCDI